MTPEVMQDPPDLAGRPVDVARTCFCVQKLWPLDGVLTPYPFAYYWAEEDAPFPSHSTFGTHQLDGVGSKAVAGSTDTSSFRPQYRKGGFPVEPCPAGPVPPAGPLEWVGTRDIRVRTQVPGNPFHPWYDRTYDLPHVGDQHWRYHGPGVLPSPFTHLEIYLDDGVPTLYLDDARYTSFTVITPITPEAVPFSTPSGLINPVGIGVPQVALFTLTAL